MNHNKYSFKPGDVVRLDKEFANSIPVKIHCFTPSEMYATVSIPGESLSNSWDVMTNRLTPMENSSEFERLQKEYMDSLTGPYIGKIVDLSTEEGQILFYNYIRQCSKEGKRELRISFQDMVHFIIHPMNVSGVTLDFTLTTNPVI